MFGILGFLGDAWDFLVAVKIFVVAGALGGGACVVAVFANRLIGGMTGLVVAFCVGAFIVGGGTATSTFKRLQDARAQERIAKLEAENKAKAAKVEELRVTNAELNAFLEEERDVARDNAEVLARLKAKIDAQEDQPDCTLSEDFLDELENLR